MANSGFVRVGVDTDQFVQGFSKVSSQLNKLSQSFEKTMDSASKSTEKTVWSVSGLKKEYDSLDKSVSKSGNLLASVFEKQEQSCKKAADSLKSVVQEWQEYDDAVAKTRSNLSASSEKTGGLFSSVAGIFSWDKIRAQLDQVSAAVMDAEQSISKLSAATGDMDSARILFNDLNNLSREIPQSFDEITAAAINLNKSGIAPTNTAVKSLAAIALGTNQSLSSVAQTVSNAALGQLRSLRQLGISATAEGDKIRMTFQGVTETIDNDAQSIQGYMERLSNQKFASTMEAQMDGITGASKRLDEAWGDLYRAIGEAGVGDAIANVMEGCVSAIDSVTAALQTPEVTQAIGGFSRLFVDAFNTVISGLEKLWEPFGEFFKGITDETDETCKAQIGLWEGFFDWLRLGLQGVTNWISEVWAYATEAGNKIGATLSEAVHGSTKDIMIKSDVQLKMTDYLKGQDLGPNSILLNPNSGKADLAAIQRLNKDDPIRQYYEQVRKSAAEANKNIVSNSPSISEKIAELERQHNKELNDAYDELIKIRTDAVNKVGANKPKFAPISSGGEDGEGSGTGKGGRGGGRAARQTDTWSRYYERLLEMDNKSKSQLEQLEFQHAQKLAEYQKMITENAHVSAEERSNALLLIETDYQEKRKQLEQDAQNFLASLNPVEAEIMRLQDGYSKKLELLEQYHSDQLISEEQFLQARQELYDQYTGDLTKQKDKDKKGKKDKDSKTTVFGVDTEDLEEMGKSLNSVSNAFGGLTSSMDEASSGYKALFAVEKAFSLASAIVNGTAAIGKGMATAKTWYEWAAVYAEAISMVGNIVSTISSVSMHDKGGTIAPGQYGIVGEIGPELVRGPATVTSRKDTADLLSRNGDITVNLIEDAGRAGQVNQSRSDEQTIIEVCVANIRRGGDIADAISNTYGVARQGV